MSEKSMFADAISTVKPIDSIDSNNISEFTIDGVGYNPSLVEDKELVKSYKNKALEYSEQLKSRDNASIEDKLEAGATFFNDTWGGEIYNYFEYDREAWQKDDKDFQNTMDYNTTLEYLNQYGLPDEYFPVISKAKNPTHLQGLLELSKKKEDNKELVRNTLTTTESIVASVGTGFLDIDVALSTVATGGAYIVAKAGIAAGKAMKINKIIRNTNTAGQIAIATTVAAVDDEMSYAEAALWSLPFAAVDNYVIKSFTKNDIVKLAEDATVALSKSEADTAIKEIKLIGLNTQEAIDRKSRELIEEINRIGESGYSGRKIEQLQKELDDLIDFEMSKANKADGVDNVKTFTDNLKNKKIAISKLKGEIRARIKASKSIGFKILKNIEKNLSKQLNDKQLALIHQTRRDIVEIASDIEMDVAFIKKDLESLAKGDKAVAEDVLGVYEFMYKNNHISKSTFEQLSASLKKGVKGKTPKIEVKLDKNAKSGQIKINGKLLRNKDGSIKKLPFALAAALTGSIASADELEVEDVTNNLGLIIVAGLLGFAAVASVKKSGGIVKAAKGLFTTSKKSEVYRKNADVRAFNSKIVDKARTTMSETVKPMLDATKGKVHEFVKKFYFDPTDGKGVKIEDEARRIYTAHHNNLSEDMSKLFNEWLSINGIGKVNNILSLFGAKSNRAEFNTAVRNFMVNGTSTSKEIEPLLIKARDAVNKHNQSMLNNLKESGVKGSDKMKLESNYVPRISNTEGLQIKIVGAVDPHNVREALVKSFASMLTKTKDADKVASIYIDNLLSAGVGIEKISISSVDDVKDILAKNNIVDDKLAQQIADDLNLGGDTFNRLKARLFMDESKFRPVDIIYENGSTGKIEFSDLFETDIMNIEGKYFKSSAGHASLAYNGFKDVAEARKVVLDGVKSGDIPSNMAKTLLQDIDATIGRPSVQYTGTMDIIVRAAGNFTIGTGMTYSNLSLISEALILGIKKSKNLLKGVSSHAKMLNEAYGTDSMLVQSLMSDDGLGLASHRWTGTYGSYKQLDVLGSTVEGGERGFAGVKAASGINKLSEVSRDFTLFGLKFVNLSDAIQLHNISDILKTIHNDINGIIKLKGYEVEAFGISDKLRNHLQSQMKLNSKGEITSFDFREWKDVDMQREFKSLLWNMMQKRTNMSTMGTTPAYGRHSALGQASMRMLSYPMSAFSNLATHSEAGIRVGDPDAIVQSMTWLFAGALQTTLRNTVKGKEFGDDYDERDLFLGAFYNSPFTGITAVTSLLNSPTAQTASKMEESINLYRIAQGMD